MGGPLGVSFLAKKEKIPQKEIFARLAKKKISKDYFC